uniref:Uncharacterized protein n=1 Tax=Arundo donax TaxID=35708 RepID=A0A0A9CIY8_ARUDO
MPVRAACPAGVRRNAHQKPRASSQPISRGAGMTKAGPRTKMLDGMHRPSWTTVAASVPGCIYFSIGGLRLGSCTKI